MTIRRGSRRTALDERRFHRWLQRHLPAGHRGRLPLGDDAAALVLPRGRTILVSSDALVEGTHFLRGTPPRWIGEAAANVNLSDIAAKGGTPLALIVDLLLPHNSSSAWPESIVRAVERSAARWGAHVVGGDTKPSPTPSVVVTVIGTADSKHLAPRSGARPGDVVVVTGPVGRGGAAALALRHGRPSLSERRRLLEVYPRIREGRVLARFAHAMLDSSDGLAESVHLMSEASGVRIELDPDRLPITPRITARGKSTRKKLEVAFFGGDYELVASLPRRQMSGVRKALGALGCPLTEIGSVLRGRGAFLRLGSHVVPLPRSGWRPFGRSGRGPVLAA